MESNDFDLQQSANAYIGAIKQKGGLSPSDETELKAHLYDGTESLREKGLSEEEAFLIVARRLGGADELSVEYSKVNPVLVTDRIWAYMLAGFGILISVRWVYVMAYELLYSYLSNYSNTRFTNLLYTGANFLVCVLIWSVLKWGHRFSGWLYRNIESRPWPIILLSLVLPAFTLIGRPISLFKGSYPGYLFGSSIAQFSYCLTLISLLSVILLSVFSIAHPGRIRFRSLFTNPSALFIVVFGMCIEFIAATTRVFNGFPILSEAAIFGTLYIAGAFCIGYFTTNKPLFYMGLFSLFGLAGETWAGMMADRARGNTSDTLYFVMAIVIGVPVGYFLAQMIKDSGKLENI